jgi:hypothetical protein
MVRSSISAIVMIILAVAAIDAQGAHAAPTAISGIVFQDANENGRLDAGEQALPGVVLSDGVQVIQTDRWGRYRLETDDSRTLSVSLPGEYRAVGDFYTSLRDHHHGDIIDFPLVEHGCGDDFSFLFFTDSHVTHWEKFNAVAGMKAAVDHMNDQQGIELVISGGDLIMDALHVCEPESRRQFELYRELVEELKFPLFNTVGNHELYGVYLEGVGGDSCIVGEDDELYGTGLYREYLGPDHYSFNWGPYHFIILNTISLTRRLNDEGDTVRVYYGNVSADQVVWMKEDLAHVPPEEPVILVSHIPFVTAVHTFEGYGEYQAINYRLEDPEARSYTHAVSNASQVINEVLAGHRFILALAGHHHHYEVVRWEDNRHDARFVLGGSISGQWWQGDRRIAGSSWAEGYLRVSLKNTMVDDLEYISYDWKGYKE